MARSAVPTYQGRFLGRAWIFIRPLWQIFGMALIFGGIFHAQSPNGVPYLLFVCFSFMAFQLFRLTVIYETRASKLVRVIRMLRVPLLLLPFATINRVLVRLYVYWAVTAIVLIYYVIAKGHLYLQLNARLLVGIAGVVLCLAYGVAVGLFTSVLYPRARDVKYLVRYLLQIWVFLTPVYYSVHQLPGWAQTLSAINPLTGVVEMVQWGFLDAGSLRTGAVLWSLGAFVLMSLSGLWFYNKLATRYLGVYRSPADEEDDDDDMV
jgi:lipopolysaccharide transport system permease protein